MTIAATAVLFISCKESEKKTGTESATAVIESKSGSDVTGSVSFTEQADGSIKVAVDVKGLEPGKHGFHLHEKGDCSADDGTSAGGHWNPKSTKHGGPDSEEHHSGDLGNITAGEDGTVKTEKVTSQFNLGSEPDALGKAVIIHAGEDDLTSQPTGAAGARVGCGVVKLDS